MTRERMEATRQHLRSLLATAGLVAGATGLGLVGQTHFASADVVMLYLLAIVASAAIFGPGPSLLASSLSILAYDFFFIAPVHTFAVENERHLLTFATMFIVGLLIGALTVRLRRREAEAVEREQRAAAAELKAKSEEMRSSLLSAVSHDLRTPLGAITGAATTLRDRADAIAAPQRRELVETICEEAERLERLVANLLEMTRLQSGAVEVKRDWVPLEELLGSALTRLEPQLDGREVRIALPPAAPLVSVDPVLMEQVFFNLIENAAKHTPPGTSIEISGGVERGTALVEVADRGAGLRPGDEAQVFEKFFRRAHDGVRGAGLGLAICRAIVEAHGGTIAAKNREGGGAAFRFELPVLGQAPDVPAEEGGAPEGGLAT
jgi:two-component system sensor histidine kinase KdpD